MSLTSAGFLFGFLPFVAIGTHLLRDRLSLRAAIIWTLVASLVWYALNDLQFLPLLLASAAFNWWLGRVLGWTRWTEAGRKRVLKFGISVDVIVLCVAKYASSFFATTRMAFPHFPIPPRFAFPLGLSFFTISQVMYLVDRYEDLSPPSGPLEHALFVSFFPNVTAGPIERARHFMKQLPALGSREGRDERLARSIMLCVLGLFKKVVLADSFGRLAEVGFARVPALSTCGAWFTALSYTFNIYFDFSGYSDMAIGIAGILGIQLLPNFNAPFRSRTISEFWQRWHITLSSFIATYLYTPILRALGKVTLNKAVFASLVSMTIAGLWHGSTWTFVLWGVMQGAAIGVYQYWKQLKRPLPSGAGVVLTFIFTCLVLIVFHSRTVGAAFQLMRALVPGVRHFGPGDVATMIGDDALLPIPPALFGAVTAFMGPTSTEIAATFRPSLRATAGVVGMLLMSFTFSLFGSQADFLYRVF